MPQFHTIYEPSSAPIRGLASAKIAAMIPPGSGVFSMIQNLRWGESGVLTVKSAATKATPTLDTSFDAGGVVPRGFATIPIGINPAFSFVGFKGNTDHKTGIYFTTNMATWIELTNGVGKHGDTRFSADEDGNDYEPTFQVVYDRFDKSSCLVMQNGFDYPRVTNAMARGSAAIHQPITPPTRSNNWGATLTWKSYVVVYDPDNITYDNDGTQFSFANTESSPDSNNAIRLTQHDEGAPSGSATIEFDLAVNDLSDPEPGLDATDCRQIAIVVKPFEGDAGVSHFLQNFKIYVKSGVSDARLVSDPLNTAKQPTVVPVDLSSRTYVIACPLDDVPVADLEAIDQIVIEAIDGSVAPSKDYKLDILCIAATGNIPGNVSYAISYANHDSKAESYEQVLATRTERLQSLGSKFLSNLRLPDTELLYYKTWISFQNTTVGERDKGVDRLRVYRKHHSADPTQSEQEFTYVGEAQIAQYIDPDSPTDPWDVDGDGHWEFTQSSVELQLRGTPDNLAPEDRLLWLTSPGAFHQTIPIARCMAVAGNRLICGARIDQQRDAFPLLRASGASMPFRFSSLSFNSDDLSDAFEQEVTGENVQGFAVAAGANLGTNIVYVFTDQAVWVLNLMAIGTPTLLSREMSVGTDSPSTIAERHGRIYFLDTDRQVRLIAGDRYVLQAPVGLQSANGEMPISLSRGLVDNLLRAIPDDRIRDARGLWFNNRYYLFYSRPNNGDLGDIGDTYNSQCLVFSEQANAWESRDVFDDNLQVECPIAWRRISTAYGSTTLLKLIALTLDNKVLQLEVPGAVFDPGTTLISVELKTGDLHNALWSGLHVKGLGLLADDQNGRQLTGEVTYKPTATTSSFTMSLDSTNPYQWSLQRSQTSAANGIAASVDITGDVKGEQKIYALKMEVEPREMLAPRAG